MVLNRVDRQRPGGPGIELIRQLFHPLPGDEQGSADDQHDRRPEEQLAFRRQGDVKPPDPLKHRVAEL